MVYFRELRSARGESQLGYRVRLWARFIFESCTDPMEQAALQRFQHMLPDVFIAEIDDVSISTPVYYLPQLTFLFSTRRFSFNPMPSISQQCLSFVEKSLGTRSTTSTPWNPSPALKSS